MVFINEVQLGWNTFEILADMLMTSHLILPVGGFCAAVLQSLSEMCRIVDLVQFSAESESLQI